MKVYALVGTSGTGKSHKAMTLASELDITYIIDDGLLIEENRKVAGYSAKREMTTIAAVKRALFFTDEHMLEVKEKIDANTPDKILILGTSDRMVKKIAARLGFNEIEKIIYIDEISTQEEIEIAKEMRWKHGKHVIPVPTLEIKRDFSGYFLDTLKVFRRSKNTKDVEFAEKTVVRPTFSYLGNYTISNKTLVQIITYVSQKVVGVKKTTKIKVRKLEHGIVLDVELIMDIGVKIIPIARRVQLDLKRDFENMTEMNIININIHIKTVK